MATPNPSAPDTAVSQNGQAVTAPTASNSNGDAAATTTPAAAQKDASAPAAPAGSDGKEKLSGAELKKRAKAEKAAKRAKMAAERAAAGGPAAESQPKPEKKEKAQQQQQQQGKQGQQGQQQQQQRDGQAQQQQQQQQQDRPLPMRRRASQSAPAGAAAPAAKEQVAPKQPKVKKEVGLFGHLYGVPKRHTIEGAAKEVHPAVLALGLQMSSYVVCGSTARCVAMLLAFKSVIHSYTTPPGTSLARHLTSHHLSPQIDYLRSCRPLSISMGNAIRALKEVIIKIDPATPEARAKAELLEWIDRFIRERITAADQLIAETAAAKIVEGDVVLTFANSSIVRQTLVRAHEHGTRFRVTVVDSKPLFEGRRLARELARHGLTVQYTLVGAAAHAIKDATKVFLGAHAMMSNGRLYSRVGTAIVAMLAHDRDVPVIVCCESVKFTERVALDSIVGNEVAPPEELLSDEEKARVGRVLRGLEEGASASASASSSASSSVAGGADDADLVLRRWRETPGLLMLNVLYDVTPAEYIKMVVTEYGSLPPSSVPVVHRMSTGTGM